MKSHYVKDLLKLNVGEHVHSSFRLLKSEKRQRENGDLFLTLQWSDVTGNIMGKWWKCTEADCHQARPLRYAIVRGQIKEYQGRKEIHLTYAPDWFETPEDVSDYEPATALPFAALQTRLAGHIASVQSPYLRALLDRVFGDRKFRTRFDEAPAAQIMHHDCRHGLLQHTIEVTDLAAAIARTQNTWGYAAVSCDLAVTGALLHDIGKVHELTRKADGGYGKSRLGTLLGHIIIGIQLVTKSINGIEGFPEELRDALLHIIESHHGKKEFDSPIPPAFPEAQIVHAADLVNVQLFYMQEAAQSATEEFIKVWKLEDRRVYTRPWEFLNAIPEKRLEEPAAVYSAKRGGPLPLFRFLTKPKEPSSSTVFKTRRLPLIGRAAAGLPKFAEEHIEGYYEVEAGPLPSDREIYLLRVDGDSMTGDGIHDNDVVVVRRQERHERDDIAVVFLGEGEEAAIKRIRPNDDGTISLLSSNPAYAPLEISDPNSMRLCGKVIGLLQEAEAC